MPLPAGCEIHQTGPSPSRYTLRFAFQHILINPAAETFPLAVRQFPPARGNINLHVESGRELQNQPRPGSFMTSKMFGKRITPLVFRSPVMKNVRPSFAAVGPSAIHAEFRPSPLRCPLVGVNFGDDNVPRPWAPWARHLRFPRPAPARNRQSQPSGQAPTKEIGRAKSRPSSV